MQRSLAIRVKHGSAEEKRQRNVAVAKTVKIFCCGYVEVEGARNWKIDHGALLKCGRDHAGMGPQHGLQRLAPSFFLTKKIAEMLLILGTILPPRDLQLNLAAQGDRMNHFTCHRVTDAELEQQRRRYREALRLGLLDLETQVRHSLPRSPVFPVPFPQ